MTRHRYHTCNLQALKKPGGLAETFRTIEVRTSAAGGIGHLPTHTHPPPATSTCDPGPVTSWRAAEPARCHEPPRGALLSRRRHSINVTRFLRSGEDETEGGSDLITSEFVSSAWPPSSALLAIRRLACDVTLNRSFALAGVSEGRRVRLIETLARPTAHPAGLQVAKQLVHHVPAMRYWHEACVRGEGRAAFLLMREAPTTVGETKSKRIETATSTTARRSMGRRGLSRRANATPTV